MVRNYQKARDALEALEESRSQVARLRRKIQYLQTRATGATSRYGTKNTAASPSQGPVELWNTLADLKQELQLRERRLSRQEKRLGRWIDMLPKPRWRMVLRYRYLDCMEFVDVADAMSKAVGREVSIHQVYRLHIQALQAAEECWP